MRDKKIKPAPGADEELFQTLQRNKKRRRARIWLTAGGITLAILLLIGMAVHSLRKRVDEKFNAGASEVLSYSAQTGSISTTVSGTGILEELDPEELTVPEGVEIEEITVKVNDPVKQGDIIALLDMSTVLSAMSKVQSELDSFDAQLADATDDAVDESVTAGVSGRVKEIYCAEGEPVADCMYEHGALMLLSTDGCMVGRIPAGALRQGDKVTVQRREGEELAGLTEEIEDGEAVISADDELISCGEKVRILNEAGEELGECAMEIRNPLRVTGFAGTVERIRVEVGDRVSENTTVLTLSDTEYSANYQAILRQREEKEQTLLELLQLSRDGALLSPIDGTVCEVLDLDAEQPQNPLLAEPVQEQKAAVISTDKQMKLTVEVDESDILSLSEGQSVELTVASVGDDQYEGTVTEIGQSAQSVSGVTRYEAQIVLDKARGMLPGMSAKALIRIQGVDDAVIIPVDAVHQTSAYSYVYTSYDPEAAEYGGRVEVTTGLSNANEVEITSGLKPGDTVYYTERRKSNPWGFGGFGQGWDSSADFGDYPDMSGADWQSYSYGPPMG